MKKLFILTLSVIIPLTFIISPGYSAKPEAVEIQKPVNTSSIALPTDPIGSNPFFGQDQSYSVTFRGNGQAVVFARILFSNNGDTSLSTLSFRFPKVDPEGVLVYQILKDQQCLKYDYSRPAVAPNYQYPCLEYGEANYSDYYSANNTYKKAKVTLSADTLTVDLPNPVAAQKSGTVIIYFRAFGFTKKNAFGAYDYTFETLKVDETIRNLRIGISPDSDLVIKGGQGNVDYFKDSAPVFESSKTMSVGSIFRNPSVDNAVNNIGYGTITKYANNLMPLDSYRVKGSYADSRLKIYAAPIIAAGLITLVILLVFTWLTIKVIRSLRRKVAIPSSAAVSSSGLNLIISALTGFVSAAIVTVLIFVGYFFLKLLSSGYYGGEAFMVLPLFGMLVFVGLIGLFLLFPAVFVGIKRGIWWGVATFAFTLFWLFVVFIVLALIIFAMHGTSPVRIM